MFVIDRYVVRSVPHEGTQATYDSCWPLAKRILEPLASMERRRVHADA